MASPFKQLCESTVNILEDKHDKLIKESEQLRILKNFVRLEEVVTRNEILALIKAMEVHNE